MYREVGISCGISLIVADAVVIAVTWIKTYRHVRRASGSQFGSYVTLSKTLLENGEHAYSATGHCHPLIFAIAARLEGSIYFMYGLFPLHMGTVNTESGHRHADHALQSNLYRSDHMHRKLGRCGMYQNC